MDVTASNGRRMPALPEITLGKLTRQHGRCAVAENVIDAGRCTSPAAGRSFARFSMNALSGATTTVKTQMRKFIAP
jgi:hypothetical protein